LDDVVVTVLMSIRGCVVLALRALSDGDDELQDISVRELQYNAFR
jgi:hypothetical protein